jgi:creatinine amidohydrolase
MRMLASMHYPEVEEAAKDPNSVVFLPTGTTEEHGPHLPLDTDCITAFEITTRVAKVLEQYDYKCIIAPTIPYGVTLVGRPWAGTLGLEPETMERVLVDICNSLAYHGFKKVVIVNPHGEKAHIIAINRALDVLRNDPTLEVFLLGYDLDYHDPTTLRGAEEVLRCDRPELDGHAGEAETSLVLLRRPEGVDKELISKLPPVYINTREHWIKGAKTFKDIPGGELGYFGAPSFARPETGEKVYEIRSRRHAEKLLSRLAKIREKKP